MCRKNFCTVAFSVAYLSNVVTFENLDLEGPFWVNAIQVHLQND